MCRVDTGGGGNGVGGDRAAEGGQQQGRGGMEDSAGFLTGDGEEEEGCETAHPAQASPPLLRRGEFQLLHRNWEEDQEGDILPALNKCSSFTSSHTSSQPVEVETDFSQPISEILSLEDHDEVEGRRRKVTKGQVISLLRESGTKMTAAQEILRLLVGSVQCTTAQCSGA